MDKQLARVPSTLKDWHFAEIEIFETIFDFETFEHLPRRIFSCRSSQDFDFRKIS